MKTSFATLTLSLVSVAYSQSISDLPSCSLDCFVSTLSGDGCSSLTDFECHCKVPGLTDKITPCVQKACSASDQQAVAEQVVDLCSQYDVTLSVPAASETAVPSSSAAASTPAPSSAVATTEFSVSATASAPESSSGSATATVTSSPSATDVVISTPVATQTTPAVSTPGGATPSPSQFDGAAPTASVVGGVVGLAVIVAAVAGF